MAQWSPRGRFKSCLREAQLTHPSRTKGNCRRVAIVTGGGSGIGKAVVQHLAADGLDATLVGRGQSKLSSTAHEVELHGVRALPLCADLFDPCAADRLVAAVLNALGTIDVIVNNAAAQSHRRILSTLSTPTVLTGQWSRTLVPTLHRAVRARRAAPVRFRRRGQHQVGDGRSLRPRSCAVRRHQGGAGIPDPMAGDRAAVERDPCQRGRSRAHGTSERGQRQTTAPAGPQRGERMSAEEVVRWVGYLVAPDSTVSGAVVTLGPCGPHQ